MLYESQASLSGTERESTGTEKARMTQDLRRKAHREKEGKPLLGAQRHQQAELLPFKEGSVPTATPSCPLHLLCPSVLGLC